MRSIRRGHKVAPFTDVRAFASLFALTGSTNAVQESGRILSIVERMTGRKGAAVDEAAALGFVAGNEVTDLAAFSRAREAHPDIGTQVGTLAEFVGRVVGGSRSEWRAVGEEWTLLLLRYGGGERAGAAVRIEFVRRLVRTIVACGASGKRFSPAYARKHAHLRRALRRARLDELRAREDRLFRDSEHDGPSAGSSAGPSAGTSAGPSAGASRASKDAAARAARGDGGRPTTLRETAVALGLAYDPIRRSQWDIEALADARITAESVSEHRRARVAHTVAHRATFKPADLGLGDKEWAALRDAVARQLARRGGQ